MLTILWSKSQMYVFCATNRKVAGSIPDGVIGIFHWHKILPIALWPWGKGGRCVRLTTLPPSCAIVMKSGNLKFLEPSGPLQACNGTTLRLLWIRLSTWSPILKFLRRKLCKPIPVDALYKASVYGCSLAGIASLNPAGGMGFFLLWVLYVVR